MAAHTSTGPSARVSPLPSAQRIKRAVKRVKLARKHLGALPASLRNAIFLPPPHTQALTITLQPKDLDALLEAVVNVEHAHDNLMAIV